MCVCDGRDAFAKGEKRYIQSILISVLREREREREKKKKKEERKRERGKWLGRGGARGGLQEEKYISSRFIIYGSVFLNSVGQKCTPHEVLPDLGAKGDYGIDCG